MLVTTGGAGTARADSRFVVGVSSAFQYSTGAKVMQADMGRLTAAGIDHIREDIFWDVVQPAAGQWDWRRYDALFEGVAKLRLDVMPIVGYGVSWAYNSTDTHRLPRTDKERALFTEFAVAVVARYGEGGSFWRERPALAPAPVRAIEVWNEPWFPGLADPASYARLVRSVANAAAKIAPAVDIVANLDQRVRATVSGTRRNWAEALIETDRDLDDVVDVWSIHPYPGDVPPAAAALDSLRQVDADQRLLAANKLTGQIWVTELGYLRNPTPAAPGASDLTAAASFRVAVLGLAVRNIGPNPVRRMYAFTLMRAGEKGVAPGTPAYGYSLIRADGSLTQGLLTLFGPG